MPIFSVSSVYSQTNSDPAGAVQDDQTGLIYNANVTTADRQAAADDFRQTYYAAQVAAMQSSTPQAIAAPAARMQAFSLRAASSATPVTPPQMDPSGVPHYYGPYANWANSPMPAGPISSITVDKPGKGYTNPVVTIFDVYSTGSGATATATVDITNGGAITGIQLTSPGSGYTAPIVVITDPSPAASGAAATANLGETAGSLSGGLRKFVDSLAGLTPDNKNNLNNYIPVAVPDKITYPGSDYYVIELGQYTQQLHSDLPPTTLRGYRQINGPNGLNEPFQYLGPLIVATKGTPVRVKFINSLPTGSGGDLFIPVDTTVMGAGMGPLGMAATPMDYTQNRANLHLHGGLTTWISDGTADQWTTPANENTPYPEGVSVYNVPDMDNGQEPPGTLTYYYNNEQSARLMFYHDHSAGITRLNVYAGEAAGYLLTDQVEEDMIAGTNVTGINPTLDKVLPDAGGVYHDGIPLIIQDKTFVDASTIASQDPTWAWGSTPGTPNTGDLWMPHVYMPNQNPSSKALGANAFGRWDYAPWFAQSANNLVNGPVPNPYYDPVNAPWEPAMIPGTPNPSMAMEAYSDTPLVNGVAYPYMEVQPTAYRFRILNAANDRYLNLQWYVADPTVTTSDGRTNTEVKMVPAAPTAGWPDTWPTDGRAGGVPDPTTAGPAFIQIGTEGGFLPAPAVINSQPVTWNGNMKTFNFGNVQDHALLLGTAERADVIVDFSQYAGKTLILYNDAPAAFPAADPRNDYYTGDPDQTSTGGAATTHAGYGPNTRTIMQVRVADTAPAPAYDLAALQSVFAKTATKRGVFEVSQDPVIVAQDTYNSAYDGNFPADSYVGIQDRSLTFQTIGGTTLTIPFEFKSIHDEMGGVYDIQYGRMSGMLGLEIPGSKPGAGVLLYPYRSPPVDIIGDNMYSATGPTAGDGTQIWKITHNGVDTHTIHFHLYNVQVINRVAWDNGILPPDANELGWKDTVRVNPLEDTIVAVRPVAPTNQPWEVPNNVRLIDPTMPEGTPLEGGTWGFTDTAGNPVTVLNHYVNYGWEYVYHCHILGHEEMDMMHAFVFGVAPRAPTNLQASQTGKNQLTLTWTDNTIAETGYTIQRSTSPDFSTDLVTNTVGVNTNSYTDTAFTSAQTFYYRVIANNMVGDTATYAGSTVGFPHHSYDSAPTNTIAVVDGTVPTMQFTSASYPVNENAGPLTVTVTLSQALQAPATVDYSTSGGTATAGQDYTATTGTLTIPAGQTSATFTVPIIDDQIHEPNETFGLALSNPNMASLGAGSVATATIIDNDPLTTYTISLQTGWNLISLPVDPVNPSVSAVFPANAQVLWTYDSGVWTYYTTLTGYDANTLSTVDSQHGYWVYADSPGSFQVTGIPPASSTIAVKTGWNLVGYPPMTPGTPEGVYPTAYVVWGFDNPNVWSFWTPVSGYDPNTLATLNTGKGYWVYIQ